MTLFITLNLYVYHCFYFRLPGSVSFGMRLQKTAAYSKLFLVHALHFNFIKTWICKMSYLMISFFLILKALSKQSRRMQSMSSLWHTRRCLELFLLRYSFDYLYTNYYIEPIENIWTLQASFLSLWSLHREHYGRRDGGWKGSVGNFRSKWWIKGYIGHKLYLLGVYGRL